ncbi:hypothetical protein LEP1GSC172_0830 [Leptospira noguchii]|uniref:Uncharacterized protein n=2 Tax=Leptospira noguchii TaxID=28182 RepID=T0FPY2_9LEPT|nr:hypothetical protein LEP1GSC172_0830 [Leptospira noguchii]EQA72249.1 hypothetical protein LEP1GSC059_4495 [Leptospira noguchii serovar Panama str. CZ214]
MNLLLIQKKNIKVNVLILKKFGASIRTNFKDLYIRLP